ncbi:hypothetical protein SO802_004298 [Lithocarpus litseifolius]|uniref:CCHC-type domain-containing protein n=1 Tax=Lithocarpus litseifolius TaxID=425828 RepID=A0AAW2E6J0_9ROSI
MDMANDSDYESWDLEAGIAALNLSSARKASIRALWSKALIVKVIGRTVGYQFLTSRIMAIWKPCGRLDCIDLKQDFFLIRFSAKEDYDKVLKEGPWFVGGHYLSIRKWEPNFKSSIASVNFANPLIKIIKVGGVKQPVQYEGINSLCFSCGCVGHKMESCPYTAMATEKVEEDEAKMADLPVVDRSVPSEETFGPWVLVSQKRQSSRKDRTQLENKDRNYFYSAQTLTKQHSRNSRSNQKLRGTLSLKGEILKQPAEVKKSKRGFGFKIPPDKPIVFTAGCSGDDMPSAQVEIDMDGRT